MAAAQAPKTESLVNDQAKGANAVIKVRRHRRRHDYRYERVVNHETHRINKVWFCNKCDRSFSKLSNMKDHCLSHGDERPYACNRCGMTFKLPGSRTRHIRNKICQNSDSEYYSFEEVENELNGQQVSD